MLDKPSKVKGPPAANTRRLDLVNDGRRDQDECTARKDARGAEGTAAASAAGSWGLLAREGLDEDDDEDGRPLSSLSSLHFKMAHVTDESVIDTQFSILNLRTLRCGIAPSHASTLVA